MSTGLKVVLIAFAAMLVLVFVITGISLISAVGNLTRIIPGSRLTEQVIEPATHGDTSKIAVITLSELICGKGSYMDGTGSVFRLTRQLHRAQKDPRVRAVILQIDSPGGALAACDIIYNRVREVQGAGKPVVVSIGGVAASGGYYIASPADYIVAGPTSLIGSIGVLIQRFEIEELLGMIGVKPTPIKSVRMKDAGSPFREMTAEERRYLEDLISIFHQRFKSIVQTGRNLSEAEVQQVADGRVFTTQQALEYKLIDEIGYFDAALAKARELSGAPDAAVVRYEEPFDIKSLMKSLPMLSQASGYGEIKHLLSETFDFTTAPQLRAEWTGRVNPVK